MDKTVGDHFYNLIETVSFDLKNKEFSLDNIKPYLNESIQLMVVEKDDYIINETNLVKKVYFVISGSYYVSRVSEQGKNNIMARRSAPQFIAIDKAVAPNVACDSANVAITKCIVLEIDQKYFLECIKTNGEVAIYIIANICEKLSAASLFADQILFHTAKDSLLLYIYRYWLNSDKEDNKCKVMMKNAIIADEIGISTRTLYRAIRQLKDAELINVHKGYIVVTYNQIIEIEQICLELGVA